VKTYSLNVYIFQPSKVSLLRWNMTSKFDCFGPVF